MQDDEVGVCRYQRGDRGRGGREIDVRFVYYYDSVVCLVGKELDDVGWWDEGAGWVAGGAEVDYFYVLVLVKGFGDGGDIGSEGWCWEEGDRDEGYVVGVCGDGVHPVRGWADEDFIPCWNAEGAEEGVDCFVASDAEEEVLGCQGRG